MAEPTQYEKDTRQMLDEFKGDIKIDIRSIYSELRSIRENVNRPPMWSQMFNHCLVAIVAGLLGYIVK